MSLQGTIAKDSLESTSFQEQTRVHFRRRLILLFTTGILASVIAIFSVQYVYDKRILLESRFQDWGGFLYGGHTLFIAVGLGLVLLPQLSLRLLNVIDFCVLEFNILLLLLSFAILSPKDLPDVHLAMILIVHAAFIPSSVMTQVLLVATALVGYPLFQLLAYVGVPEVRGFWADHGGLEALKNVLLLGALEGVLYGGLSIQINRTLYTMRRKLHKAEKLGNYVIERKLGGGGMGTVFMASHSLMCRPAAIKVIRPESQDSADALARFEREVRLSATLTHPNTIVIFDYGRSDSRTFYYVMEYLEGIDLQRLVERFGPLPAERAVFILLQACSALAEAHSRRIVHRDIKPSNIYLTQRGNMDDFVKVLDFGLAKKLEEKGKAELSQTGAFFGTPLYMSPESAQGMDQVDARSDIYQLGAVAFWMLTGKPVFVQPSHIEVMVDHLKTPPPRPSQSSELPIPEALDRIVLKCLEKDPALRFQSADELKDALAALSFPSPWTQEKAKAWWSLHRSNESR